MSIRALVPVGLLLITAGCGGPRAFAPATEPGVLRGAELRPMTDYNALDAIRQLRPLWLNTRGGTISIYDAQRPEQADARPLGPKAIRVYVNGIAMNEGVEQLARLQIREITEMRHLDGAEASFRYGFGHEVGAILVEMDTSR